MDDLFFWLHIVVICFNLFGWIWVKTRKLHLVVLSATLFSWIVLGIKYGLGYCFLTDWHWEIKRNLGEHDLPASFIKYFLDQYTPIHLSAEVVDWITGIVFVSIIFMTIYINFIKKRPQRKSYK